MVIILHKQKASPSKAFFLISEVLQYPNEQVLLIGTSYKKENMRYVESLTIEEPSDENKISFRSTGFLNGTLARSERTMHIMDFKRILESVEHSSVVLVIQFTPFFVR